MSDLTDALDRALISAGRHHMDGMSLQGALALASVDLAEDPDWIASQRPPDDAVAQDS
ncbi:MAG TPA: hypothetical protein VGS19_23895 [Streptosporangiaceae bacterium]|nr:hypothetical protein [Streptosporangiaceae bacterium]